MRRLVAKLTTSIQALLLKGKGMGGAPSPCMPWLQICCTVNSIT